MSMPGSPPPSGSVYTGVALQNSMAVSVFILYRRLHLRSRNIRGARLPIGNINLTFRLSVYPSVSLVRQTVRPSKQPSLINLPSLAYCSFAQDSLLDLFVLVDLLSVVRLNGSVYVRVEKGRICSVA